MLFQKWQFTTGFCPVEEWDFSHDGAAIHEHLKHCPFNQDKNVKSEPFQMIIDLLIEEPV